MRMMMLTNQESYSEEDELYDDKVFLYARIFFYQIFMIIICIRTLRVPLTKRESELRREGKEDQ